MRQIYAWNAFKTVHLLRIKKEFRNSKIQEFQDISIEMN